MRPIHTLPILPALVLAFAGLIFAGCANTIKANSPAPNLPGDPLATIYGHEMIRTGSTMLIGDANPRPQASPKASRRGLDFAAWELSRYDVIFIGELHGNAGVHHGQLALLAAIDRFSSRPLALSMEHFQRDTQPIVDDYLAGKLGEEPFIKSARAWKDYARDYRPLVEYAKDHGMAVIAANAADVPRRKVSAWRKEGKTMEEALAMLPAEERPLIAREINPFDGRYRRKFFGFMGISDLEAASEDHTALADRSFSMQCVWDDTMAESIADFLATRTSHQVVHVAGCMHSDEFLGTAERLALRNPALKIAVVAPQIVADWQSGEARFSAQDLGKGTYLMLVRPEPEKFVDENERKAVADAQRAAHEKIHGAGTKQE